MDEKRNNNLKIIILVQSIIIVVLLIYIYFNNKDNPDQDIKQQSFNEFRNFSLSDKEKNETNFFFNNDPSEEQINQYCIEKRMNCIYYCRENSPTSTFCTQLIAQSGRQNYGVNQ